VINNSLVSKKQIHLKKCNKWDGNYTAVWEKYGDKNTTLQLQSENKNELIANFRVLLTLEHSPAKTTEIVIKISNKTAIKQSKNKTRCTLDASLDHVRSLNSGSSRGFQVRISALPGRSIWTRRRCGSSRGHFNIGLFWTSHLDTRIVVRVALTGGTSSALFHRSGGLPSGIIAKLRLSGTTSLITIVQVICQPGKDDAHRK
jgi:hypothetical protein